MGLLQLSIGQRLAEMDIAQISPHACPFELIAPLAAWYFIDTGYRHQAESSLVGLKAKGIEFLNGPLGDLMNKDPSLLANSYHRSLLETIRHAIPNWTLECDLLGHFYLLAPIGEITRGQGEQFGMLKVFFDSRELMNHLKLSRKEQSWLGGAQIVQTLQTGIMAISGQLDENAV